MPEGADEGVPWDAPWDAPWRELVPPVDGRRITAMDPFAEQLVLHEWHDAQPRIRWLDRHGREAGGAEPATIDEALEWDSWGRRRAREVLEQLRG